MGLEEEFNQAVEEWTEYCRENAVYSSPRPYLDCDAYKRIIAFGPKSLPLIRSVYDKDSSNNLGLRSVQKHLINAVVIMAGKNFVIPEEARGKIQAMQDYTKRWLDENMHKYV